MKNYEKFLENVESNWGGGKTQTFKEFTKKNRKKSRKKQQEEIVANVSTVNNDYKDPLHSTDNTINLAKQQISTTI